MKPTIRLFKCEWHDGDVSFVQARSVDDAIMVLDQIGGASPTQISPVQLNEQLILTFSPCGCNEEQYEGEPHWHFNDDQSCEELDDILGNAQEALENRNYERELAGLPPVEHPEPLECCVCHLAMKPGEDGWVQTSVDVVGVPAGALILCFSCFKTAPLPELMTKVFEDARARAAAMKVEPDPVKPTSAT